VAIGGALDEIVTLTLVLLIAAQQPELALPLNFGLGKVSWQLSETGDGIMLKMTAPANREAPVKINSLRIIKHLLERHMGDIMSLLWQNIFTVNSKKNVNNQSKTDYQVTL
ncbi:MAG: hypothetical protein HGA95_03020, partial [Caldiserica bacterium]|nr:hypothetical protein [Caldisericota bacterium]